MAHKHLVLSDSQPHAAAAEASHAVFIDTTLHTHLLMILSRNDTVSHFKRKIEKEHALCFTDIGEIVVHALKVKRRGHLYHLSDSMLVRDAFIGANKNWFLSVDATTVETKIEEEKCVQNLDSDNRIVSSDPNMGRQNRIEFESDMCGHDILGQQGMLVELEEARQTGAALTKKRKVEEIVGNGHLQEEETDSGKDASKAAIVSQRTSVENERSESGAVDGSATKPVNDNNPLEINSSSIKKKKRRKKTKSIVNQVADGVPSSGKEVVSTDVNHKVSGVEPNTASVHGEGEDEITTPEPKQKCSDTIREAQEQEPLTVEVGHKTAATKEDTKSAVSKEEHSRDHHPSDDESNPSLVLKEPKELQTSAGVPVLKDFGGGRAERAEEQGILSKKNGSVGEQSEKLDSHSLDETVVQTKDIIVTADLVDQSGTIAPKDTNKKRKRTKKTMDQVEKALSTSGTDVQKSETNVIVEPLAAKCGVQTRNEESNLPSANENEALKVNKESTLLTKENVDITGNEVKNTQKTINKMETSSNAEEEPVRKKSKKKQILSSKNLPDVQVENRDVIRQIPTPPTVNKSEIVPSSSTKKKGKVEKPIKDQSNGGKLKSENFAVKTDSGTAEPSLSPAKSPKAQSGLVDHGNKGNSVEVHLTNYPLNTSETNNQIEVSGVGNKRNVPNSVTSSEVRVDRKTAAKTAAKAPKATKNVKKPDINSTQTSSIVQSSLKSNGERQIEGSLKEKSDESMVHPGKKLPKASKNAAKAPSSVISDKLNSISKETGKHSVANVTGTTISAEKKADSASVSNSCLERPKKIASQSTTSNKRQSGTASNLAALASAAAAKFSDRDNSATVNSSESKKKLVATLGSIFKNDSLVSSDDEGTDSSDASTKTPSDYSSDSTDGESNANLKSPQKGSHTVDRTKSVERKSIIKSCSSRGKDLRLDVILRSSSRYKKAKMTASQLQLEEESQPVDFVPDSQAD